MWPFQIVSGSVLAGNVFFRSENLFPGNITSSLFCSLSLGAAACVCEQKSAQVSGIDGFVAMRRDTAGAEATASTCQLATCHLPLARWQCAQSGCQATRLPGSQAARNPGNTQHRRSSSSQGQRRIPSAIPGNNLRPLAADRWHAMLDASCELRDGGSKATLPGIGSIACPTLTLTLGEKSTGALNAEFWMLCVLWSWAKGTTSS